MALRLELCSSLRRHVPGYDPAEGIELTGGEGMTVAQAIRKLRIPLEEVQVIMVNRTVTGSDQLLMEGDLVGLFSAPAGG